jgi:biopolymer transport protein ExbD
MKLAMLVGRLWRFAVVVAVLACGRRDDYDPTKQFVTVRSVDAPLTTRKLEPLGDAISVVVTPSTVTIETKSIVQIDKGRIDCAEKEGGCEGKHIVKVDHYIHALLAQSDGGVPLVQIAVDRTVSYRVLSEVLYSVHAGGASRIALVANSGGALGTIPVATEARGTDTPTVVVQWQGAEIRGPATRQTDLGRLASTLREVAPSARQVTVTAPADLPMQPFVDGLTATALDDVVVAPP